MNPMKGTSAAAGVPLASAADTAPAAGAAPAVKLSCRNVWKVFGRDPAGTLSAHSGGTPSERKAALAGASHVPAVVDATFDVREGEIFVIMGLSGSGKSTLVRCLSRLVEPTSGEILLDGRNLLDLGRRELTDLRRHKMGMVFQSFGLMPHLTVLENVCFPLRIQGVPERERVQRAEEMIALVGLEGREGATPAELSGGQQQRVGIARSLAVGPELWFLDEPFSALDPLIRRQMQLEFVRLQSLLNKTIVFITHDFLEALKIADRVAIMKDGEVVQIGRPADIVLNPVNSYVAEFTSDVSLLRVISAADVMEPADAAADRTGAVSCTTSLETLLPGFAHSDRPLAVIGPDGGLAGQVTPRAILRRLAEEEERIAAAVGAPS